MRRSRFARAASFALAAAAMVGATRAPATPAGLVVERVIIVMRHGVRTPLDGEVPAGTRTSAPWPRWPVAPGLLTPHGAAALARQGADERRWLARRGILAGRTCPGAALRVWTNTAARTIASGAAFADGLAPGCAVVIGHLADDRVDPLFEPLRAGVAPFDPAKAIASIDRHTGGVDRLAARHAPALRLLDRVLGCAPPGACDSAGVSAVTAAADGRGVDLSGPIRTASGTAQALLLEYLEGLPRAQVGWGRADPRVLRRLGTIHAALFDVFTRPPYMTARQVGPLGRRIRATLTAAHGPRVDVLVGHDTNVTALAAALRVTLVAPGYAVDDVPPGGALVMERLRRRADGARFVRLSYHSQSPQVIRALESRVDRTPLRLPDCMDRADGLCPLARFARLLTPPGSGIAPRRH